MFSCEYGLTGCELWRSDGTEAGTVRVTRFLVQDIGEGAGSSVPARFAAAGPRIFFAAQQVQDGRELWSMPWFGQYTSSQAVQALRQRFQGLGRRRAATAGARVGFPVEEDAKGVEFTAYVPH